MRDADFRAMWADYEAIPLLSGIAPALIEGFGFGEFPWQIFNVPDGLFMVAWLAPPGTFAADAIAFLRETIGIATDGRSDQQPRGAVMSPNPADESEAIYRRLMLASYTPRAVMHQAS